jgi:hypothetical protein
MYITEMNLIYSVAIKIGYRSVNFLALKGIVEAAKVHTFMQSVI